MSEVFVIRNQFGHYWGKGKCWVDGGEPRAVMRARHRDEAVNTLFELSSRDIDLRGEVASAELDERSEPLLEPSSHPLPQAEPAVATEGDPAPDAAATTLEEN